MLVPRYYQAGATDALFDYWEAGGENGLIEMATGTGKSLVQAMVDQRLLNDYQGIRILNLTHVKELIAQNYQELLGILPWAPAGIYSAGLSRKELNTQIVFGGIASIFKKARQLGHVDLIKVDEVHLVSPDAEGMYGRLINDLYDINPDMRVAGFTATSFRLSSGSLVEGDVRLFNEIVYKYGIAQGIKDGYLAPLVSKAMDTGFDLTGVGRRGGEYIQSALQDACDIDSVTKAAVDEIVEYGQNRKSWLLFCAGVKHAEHVRDEVRRRGYSCETISSETSDADRIRWIAEFKAGRLRCLTNNGVLTTGNNFPGVDLIGGLRVTLSGGLFVQMAGRGTRPLYAPGYPLDTVEQRLEAIAAGPKPNCLYLDFAGNGKKHGPIDLVTGRTPGKGDGEQPIKECMECHSLVHISAKVCPDCGTPFITEEKAKHEAKAVAVPILSSEAIKPQWLPVQQRKFHYHDKVGGTPSIRVEFTCNWVVHKTWWCPGHKGFAKDKADREWRHHGGQMPAPCSPEEFLKRQNELSPTKEIQIKPNGKYFEVCGIKPAAANDNLKSLIKPANDNTVFKKVAGLSDFNDDIPF